MKVYEVNILCNGNTMGWTKLASDKKTADKLQADLTKVFYDFFKKAPTPLTVTVTEREME